MDVNIAASEWSNGCESGWTGYLHESYITRNDNVGYSQRYRLGSTQNDDDDDNNEVEDLSMVSDASSGPPHALVREEDDYQQSYSRSISRNNTNCCYLTNSEKSSKKSAKKSKKSSNKEHNKVSGNNNKHQHHQQYHLDDTASSPAVSTHYQMYVSPSNINMDGFSQNFSSTHFEGNSSYSNHYAFWQSSHVKDTDYSADPGQLSGRGWE